MRYVLHFNPEATGLLNGDFLEIEKLPKPLKSGARARVRTVRSGEVPFTPRDATGSRFGAAVSRERARESGLSGSQRYVLERSGRSKWFNLVPHSKIRPGQPVRIDGPGVSVSIIERNL